MTARTKAQRKRDVLEKLRTDVDLWVASADENGNAYLVPLSFYWDGNALTISTPRASRTATNLELAGWARLQAWREENELAGRQLMRDGEWLA